MAQFRGYISAVFADQLEGKVNDVRGDKSSARPKLLEDLAGWPSLLRKFEGAAIGSELKASRGTVWSAYQSVTEFLSHEAGRAKQADQAARLRFESLYWGKSADTLQRAHSLAMTIN
jgi:hypothetical protein